MHMQVPWSVFANALQRHYLRVTASPRPLSTRDLANLHHRLGDESRVSLNDFDNFWKWFGKVSKQIHLQKNLPLWVKGVIFGFVTKKDSQELLKNESDGCCVIRFSDKNPGQFAIAYLKVRSSARGVVPLD